MPVKGDGPGELRVVGRYDRGLTWMAHPEEGMQRASHALVSTGAGSSAGNSQVTDGEATGAGDDIDGEAADVWVIDPVDAPGLDDRLAELGEVAGVVVLVDRHERDAGRVARRHDAPVYLPPSMNGVDPDVPVERFDGELADTGFRARSVVDNRFWRETALYDPDDGTLVVQEALGTAPFYLTSDERLGVHPVLRAMPPRRALGDVDPERVLVGHGSPVLEDAAAALGEALAGSRRRLPRLYAKTVRSMLST